MSDTFIRVIIAKGKVSFGGRTANAQIPVPLVTALNEQFLPLADSLNAQFPNGAVLYGEGYGAKIQKVGHLYRPDHGFVLFDIRVGDYWLHRWQCEDIAKQFAIDIVPVIGEGTLNDAIDIVTSGRKSMWGDFEAEGIVARPLVELKTRNGDRIITKIKGVDFK